MPPKKASQIVAPFWGRVRQVFRPATPPRDETVETSAGAGDYGVYHDQFNPDPVLQTTGKGLELYRRMLFDDKIAGTLDLQKRIVLSADWEIKPASDRRKDIKVAEFVKEALEDEEMEIPILDVLDNLLDAKPYGFKIAEKLWRERTANDGKQSWIYKAIKCKPSFDFHFWTDKFSNLECVYAGEWYGDKKPPEKMCLPRDRIIIFVWPYVQDGNWNGTSVLSQLYREWFVKQHMYKFRNIDAQKFGMPTVRCYLNDGNTDEQDDAIKTNLDKWPENLVLYIPTTFLEDGTKIPQAEIDFLEKKTRGSPQFDSTIEKLNVAMERKLLVPDMMGFADIEHGSRALGETQFDLILLDAVHTHRRLSDMANAQIIPDLVRFNFGDNVDLPKWIFLPFEDPAKKAEVLGLMIDKGVVDPTEEWVRAYLQFPERPPEIEEEPKKDPVVPPPEQDEEEPENAPGDVPPESQTMAVPGRFDFKQARTWFDEIQGEMQPIVEQALFETSASMMDRAESQKLLEEKDWKGINKLQPKGIWKRQLRKAILDTEMKMYFQGRLSGTGDLRHAGLDVSEFRTVTPLPFPEWAETEKYLDRTWLKNWLAKHQMKLLPADRAIVTEITNYSFKLAGKHSQEIIDEVGQIIYTNLNSMMPKEISALVHASMGTVSSARSNLIVRNNASSYFNRGRMQTFSEAADFIQGYDYDAILDGNETPFCHDQDGRFITEDNPMFARINPPNHNHCRSILVPRMKSDPPATQQWRQGLIPAKKFGG